MLKSSQNARPIYDMQTAIIAYKTEAQKHPVFSMNPEEFGGKTKKSVTPITKDYYGTLTPSSQTPLTTSTDNLGGYSHFNKFITDNYLKNKDFGKQFLPVDLSEPGRTSVGAGDLNNLSSLIDSIGRVGTPGSSGGKGEIFVDGNWGARTNNALKLIYNVSKTILLVAKDLGIDTKEFPIDSIEEFGKAIPTENAPYKSINVVELQKLAIKMKKYIVISTDLLQEFSEKVLSNSKNAQFISQEKGILPLDKAPVHPENDRNLSEVFEKNKNSTFQAVLGDKTTTFTIDDLSSLDKFKAAISKVDPAWAGNDYLEQAYNSVRKSALGV